VVQHVTLHELLLDLQQLEGHALSEKGRGGAFQLGRGVLSVEQGDNVAHRPDLPQPQRALLGLRLLRHTRPRPRPRGVPAAAASPSFASWRRCQG
jgi:hypothetical protein